MIQFIAKYTICTIVLLASAVFACAAQPQDIFVAKMAALEKHYGGRVGVTVTDKDGAVLLSYRGGERFPMCSTFKAVLAAAVLKRAEADKGFLDKKIPIGKSFIAHSPVTEKYANSYMTIRELCSALMSISDNTAANLLLVEVGGPSAVTQFAQGIDGGVFRLDRVEPELNSAIPGDERDTITPDAMAHIFQGLLFTDILSDVGARQFESWLLSSVTGAKRILVGIPSDWRVGSKTGSGAYGTANETGILYRPKKSPLIVSIFYTKEEKGALIRDDIIAEITKNIIGNMK